MPNNGIRLTISKQKNPMTIVNKVAQKVKDKKCITDSQDDQLGVLTISDSDIAVFDAKEWAVGPALETLVFRNNLFLRRVTGFETMPNLKSLSVINSDKLEKIDDSILTCSHLKTVVLHGSLTNNDKVLDILNGAITTVIPCVSVVSKCLSTDEVTSLYYGKMHISKCKENDPTFHLKDLREIRQFYDEFVDEFCSNIVLKSKTLRALW